MPQTDLDVGAIINITTPLALDLIAWIRNRHQQTGELPTDAEVIARAKAKVQVIMSQGAAALQEFPEGS
jgi:hypothetical protein